VRRRSVDVDAADDREFVRHRVGVVHGDRQTHHQGFLAYSEDALGDENSPRGTRKLIDGLWFYEDKE